MIETKRPKEIARTEKVSRARCKPESEKKNPDKKFKF